MQQSDLSERLGDGQENKWIIHWQQDRLHRRRTTYASAERLRGYQHDSQNDQCNDAHINGRCHAITRKEESGDTRGRCNHPEKPEPAERPQAMDESRNDRQPDNNAAMLSDERVAVSVPNSVIMRCSPSLLFNAYALTKASKSELMTSE